MAGTVNLSFKIVNSNGVGIASTPVVLLNQIYSNPFTAISTSVATSGTTDPAGGVLLTGVNAGTYDINIIGTGSTVTIRNYVVKNEFPIAIGGSSAAFESRNFIQAGQSASNILAESFVNSYSNTNNRFANTINNTGTLTNAYTTTQQFPVTPPYTGTELFTATITHAKQTGNSYYHSNGSIPFTQKARFSVSI